MKAQEVVRSVDILMLEGTIIRYFRALNPIAGFYSPTPQVGRRNVCTLIPVYPDGLLRGRLLERMIF